MPRPALLVSSDAFVRSYCAFSGSTPETCVADNRVASAHALALVHATMGRRAAETLTLVVDERLAAVFRAGLGTSGRLDISESADPEGRVIFDVSRKFR